MDKNPHVAEMRRVFHKTRLVPAIALDAKIVGGVLDYVETLEARLALALSEPAPKPADKIMPSELLAVFGQWIPMEAMAIIWNAGSETPVGTVRERLDFFAEGWKAREKHAARLKEHVFSRSEVASAAYDAGIVCQTYPQVDRQIAFVRKLGVRVED